MQNYFNDIAGFDISYDEFNDLCGEAWKEKYSYLKNKRLGDEEKYCFCNECKKECNFLKP